jgi:hypothetical protein
MAAILIVTVGTRDLMFQISSGTWYNVGNNQVQGTNIITEHLEVTEDLKSQQTTQRGVTKYLQEHQDQYLDRLKPVIIGKLLIEQASQIEKLYLIGTDQHPPVRQKIIDKDSIHSCEIIKAWVEINYKIPTTIITIGPDGTSPANFEAMFEWWRKQWRTEIKPAADTEIWLGLKGGVGQTSEAGRISGLSLYGDRIKFFEFHEDEDKNQAGQPSDYSGPFLGTNYLWDRTRQQALQQLDRYDYAGAQKLLEPYSQSKKLGAIPNLLKAGIAWNRGEFDSFLKYAKSTNALDDQHQQQSQSWWWMAYEQAYLAVIRLQQNNIVEAMLHSFRSVEGCLLIWAKEMLGKHFQDNQQDSPIVLNSILESHPKLKDSFKSKKPEKRERGEIEDYALWMLISVQRGILKVSLPTALEGDFEYFWSDDCRRKRNEMSHRLGGMSERELLSAWGEDINDRSQWAARILACLNILTGKSFKTLQQASLFAKVQDEIRRSIESI